MKTTTNPCTCPPAFLYEMYEHQIGCPCYVADIEDNTKENKEMTTSTITHSLVKGKWMSECIKCSTNEVPQYDTNENLRLCRGVPAVAVKKVVQSSWAKTEVLTFDGARDYAKVNGGKVTRSGDGWIVIAKK